MPANSRSGGYIIPEDPDDDEESDDAETEDELKSKSRRFPPGVDDKLYLRPT